MAGAERFAGPHGETHDMSDRRVLEAQGVTWDGLRGSWLDRDIAREQNRAGDEVVAGDQDRGGFRSWRPERGGHRPGDGSEDERCCEATVAAEAALP